MCVTAALAWMGANVGTIASVAGAAAAVHNATKGSGPSAGELQTAADNKAAQNSNARLAARRRALSSQSLLTGAADAQSGVLGGGKTVLGG